jgi:hypothetical protein
MQLRRTPQSESSISRTQMPLGLLATLEDQHDGVRSCDCVPLLLERENEFAARFLHSPVLSLVQQPNFKRFKTNKANGCARKRQKKHAIKTKVISNLRRFS